MEVHVHVQYTRFGCVHLLCLLSFSHVICRLISKTKYKSTCTCMSVHALYILITWPHTSIQCMYIYLLLSSLPERESQERCLMQHTGAGWLGVWGSRHVHRNLRTAGRQHVACTCTCTCIYMHLHGALTTLSREQQHFDCTCT